MQGFQSRNRGSFDFKSKQLIPSPNRYLSFNLVIEVLLISSHQRRPQERHLRRFQSRNRGSFDFKLVCVFVCVCSVCGFNLVIEVLLISSKGAVFNEYTGEVCFNLVIEVLLISSRLRRGWRWLLRSVSIS